MTFDLNPFPSTQENKIYFYENIRQLKKKKKIIKYQDDTSASG